MSVLGAKADIEYMFCNAALLLGDNYVAEYHDQFSLVATSTLSIYGKSVVLNCHHTISG